MPSECERHGGQLSQARALHQQVSAGEGGAQPWPDETPPQLPAQAERNEEAHSDSGTRGEWETHPQTLPSPTLSAGLPAVSPSPHHQTPPLSLSPQNLLEPPVSSSAYEEKPASPAAGTLVGLT